MDKSSDIFRQPPHTGPSFRDLLGPLLGFLGGAAFLAAIVYTIIWLNSLRPY